VSTAVLNIQKTFGSNWEAESGCPWGFRDVPLSTGKFVSTAVATRQILTDEL
jgi:hypothetical protein